MNIFFSLIASEVSYELSNRIINRYIDKGRAYIAYFKPYVEKNKLNLTDRDYQYDKLVRADYSDCVFYKDCPPLDTDLLLSMAEYESVILKMLERHSYTPRDFDSRVRIYHKHLRYWNYMLDVAKIELVVFTNIPHEVWDYVLYCLCKKKNIITVFPYLHQIEPYGYFSSDIETQGVEVLSHYERLAEQYKGTPMEEIELPPDFQRYFDLQTGNNDKTPHYMKKSGRLLKLTAFPRSWKSHIKTQRLRRA